MNSGHVKIFDTTLRDGEQAPGFSMATDAKLLIARGLQKLNVDVIEAGFAAASDGDAAAVKTIATEIEGPTICSLARLSKRDIDIAASSLEPASNRRIHTFIGTSPTHRNAKLKMSQVEILDKISELVAYAVSISDDVEFSAEDAIRTERDYLIDVVNAAIQAGAKTINIPDTVGYTTPEEMADLFQFLTTEVPRADEVVFSVHCHDDLGMAVANSLAAVRNGARQIECALNGIGERAGNCSLEEAVMAIHTRQDQFSLKTQIDTPHLYSACKTVAHVTHNPIPRNKAIVGQNAFAHEAGIHQHGVLQDKRTYEIMDAESVGMPPSAIVLGKHSGKHALAAHILALGIDVSDEEMETVFSKFKSLADTAKYVTDADIVRIATGANDFGRSGPWRVRRVELRAEVDDEIAPYARITMRHENGERQTVTRDGNGPIDAAFSAVCAITGVNGRISVLDLHHVADEGIVRAEAKVEIDDNVFTGVAREVDIADAAVNAFVIAVNQAVSLKGVSKNVSNP